MSQRYAEKKEIENIRKGLEDVNFEIEYIKIQLDHIKKSADEKNKKRRFLKDFHFPSQNFWCSLILAVLCVALSAFSILAIVFIIKTKF